MEMPKPNADQPPRQVTGEVVYLDALWKSGGMDFGQYAELDPTERQMYEDIAATHLADGTRPSILDEYETHEPHPTQAHAVCRALLDELHRLKDPDIGLTFVDINVEPSPEQVLSMVQSTESGRLLRTTEMQLAIPADSHHPDIDVRLADAELSGVTVRVWKWDDEKYLALGDEYPRSILRFPSDERNSWGQIDIGFHYQHQESAVAEIVSLHVSEAGMRMSSDVWLSEYAETGYEGHDGRSANLTEDDMLRFAEIVADIVGDQPISVRELQERSYELYLSAIVSAESKEYVLEWVANSWFGQVMHDMTQIQVGEKSLFKALTSKDHAAQAEAVLKSHVDNKRQERNQFVATADKDNWLNKNAKPWSDRVLR